MVSYAIATIEAPGPGSTITGVGGTNDFGQIVGTLIDGSGNQMIFVRTAGRFDTIPDRSADLYRRSDRVEQSRSSGGGPDGAVFGGLGDASFTKQFHPLTRRFNNLQTLVSPFGGSGEPGGINDFGQVVGTDAFIAPGGIAGTIPWVEKAGVFTKLPQVANFTEPTDINDLGQVTGWSSNDSGACTMIAFQHEQGFVETNGTVATIAVPGAYSTVPTAIDNLGVVAGYYSVLDRFAPNTMAIHGFVEVGGQYTTVDVPGATATGLSGINDFGQILGESSNAKGQREFVATPVLTPADQARLGDLALDTLGLAMRQGISGGP